MQCFLAGTWPTLVGMGSMQGLRHLYAVWETAFRSVCSKIQKRKLVVNHAPSGVFLDTDRYLDVILRMPCPRKRCIRTP